MATILIVPGSANVLLNVNLTSPSELLALGDGILATTPIWFPTLPLALVEVFGAISAFVYDTEIVPLVLQAKFGIPLNTAFPPVPTYMYLVNVLALSISLT
jgi:hypothetical protein